MSNGENFLPPKTVEEAKQQLSVCYSLPGKADYADYYQSPTDMTGLVLAGQVATPEGLILKAFVPSIKRSGRGCRIARG